LSAVHGAIIQNAVQHKLEVKLGAAAGATVLGTYGSDPGIVEQVLNTLQLAPSGPMPAKPVPAVQFAPVTPHAPVVPAVPAPAGTATSGPPKPSAGPADKASAGPTPTYTNWRGVPAHWPVQIVQPPKPPPKPFHPVSGFDTCAAPSTATMRAWRGSYSVVGVYIGGANAACASANLTAGWVQTVAAMGWGLLPTYVGPQSPCWGGSGVPIIPGTAAAQGTAAGLDAVGDAETVGLAPGSPIYYDMEAYKGGASCTKAVLAFLGAWDRQVDAAGYRSGVYSSQASGISDMQAAAVNKTAGFTPPDALWIALWDNVPSLSDGTLAWPPAARSKQYAGSVNVTIGGTTMNVDQDIVGGPVARLSNQFASTAAGS
jgi:Rv2525c-like, glycoside hydrolase-like domain